MLVEILLNMKHSYTISYNIDKDHQVALNWTYSCFVKPILSALFNTFACHGIVN